jgi:hypothetical protein
VSPITLDTHVLDLQAGEPGRSKVVFARAAAVYWVSDEQTTILQRLRLALAERSRVKVWVDPFSLEVVRAVADTE